MNEHYIIIGASAAGIAAANQIKKNDPQAEVICISKENEYPYNKCFLADYMVGAKEEKEIFLRTSLEEKDLIKDTVVSINAINKHIECSSGTRIEYGKLLLAMGSSPFIPPLMQKSYEGMFTFHTLNDANTILGYCKQNNISKAVIIGAGLSGIECADALYKNDISVSIIERSARILPTFLDENSSTFLQAKIENCGVKVYCNQIVKAIEQSNNQVAGVQLENGDSVPTSLVIITTGLRPNILLAQQAGIVCNEYGILVNEYMQTNIADIYAAGDVITVIDRLTNKWMGSCTWPDAMLQGMHTAHAMTNNPRPYLGPSIITSSSFFDLHLAHAGILEIQDKNDTLVAKEGTDFCYRILLRNGILKGFSIVGPKAILSNIRKYILNEVLFEPTILNVL